MARLAAASGLRYKLLSHPEEGRAYIVLGAPIACLAREAERIALPVQLRADMEERLRRTVGHEGVIGRPEAAAKPGRFSEREGGTEAYAPYRRRVHDLFQLAAPPLFFSSAQVPPVTARNRP